MAAAIARLLASASLPPRSTTALPVFRQIAATSLVTFGRDSYTTPTTPSGTRLFEIASPLGRVSCRTARRWDRRDAQRPRHRVPCRQRARASGAGDRSRFAATHSRSPAHWRRGSPLSRARIASAIAMSARFFSSVDACASTIEAAFAPAALSISSSVVTGIPNPQSLIPSRLSYSITTLFRWMTSSPKLYPRIVVISADRHPLIRSRSPAL